MDSDSKKLVDSNEEDNVKDKHSDAVVAAKSLVCPTPKSRHTHECDHQYFDFWRKNDDLIKQAWKDYPFKHDQLRYFNEKNEALFIQREFLDAVSKVRNGEVGEESLTSFFDEPIPGVFRSNKIFTPEFLNMVLEEIDHKNNAGIPLHRPNSMNRFGVILKTVEMGGFLRDLSRMYLAPIMGMLFPDIIGINDVFDQHGFTVRYKHGEDLELKEHRDSSNATMNLCLGRPGFTGSSLYFREGQTSTTREFSFNVGDAIFHKGSHQHAALPLKTGERTNLVIWMYGEDGHHHRCPHFEYSSEEKNIFKEERWKLYHFQDYEF